MEINITFVILAAVAQFILGALWYSPLMFGKMWMQIMEATHLTNDELKKMQKEMMPFYVLQLLLTLFTTFSFANLVPYVLDFNIYHIAFWIWIGFIAPVQIGCVIWANTKRQYWFKQSFIMVTYQLVAMMLMAYILSM